jgi:hypothetical protein
LRFVRTLPGTVLDAAYFSNGSPNKYYVSVSGLGILGAPTDDLSAIEPLADSPGRVIGLIEIGEHLVAVTRNGTIWKIEKDGTVPEENKTNFDVLFNGALAAWKDPYTDSGKDVDLLLLGSGVPWGSSATVYEYGYRELPTDDAGNLDLTAFLQRPGAPRAGVPTSASNYDSYYNTLDTHAVTSLYQAPYAIDPKMPVFASTQKDGLWSCREQGNPKEWDIE